MDKKNGCFVCWMIFLFIIVLVIVCIDVGMVYLSQTRHDQEEDHHKRTFTNFFCIMSYFQALTPVCFLGAGCFAFMAKKRWCEADQDKGCILTYVCLGILLPFFGGIAGTIAGYYKWKLYFYVSLIKWVLLLGGIGGSLCVSGGCQKVSEGGGNWHWVPNYHTGGLMIVNRT